MRRAFIPAVAVLIAELAGPGSAPAADIERGRILYEARCDGCHTQSVHGRDKRVAADFASVRTWVRRWNENLGLKWTDGEIEDVAVYLNARHYRFACPPPACPATGRRDDGRSSVAAR